MKQKQKEGSNRNSYELFEESEEDLSDDETDHKTIKRIENYKEPKTDRSLDELLNTYSI